MYANDFEFDGRNLSDYGFVICDIDGSTEPEIVSAGGVITIQKERYGIGKRFFPVSAIYEECITADFTIAKDPCVYDDTEITDDEMRDMMRWINRRAYKRMRFLKEPQDETGEACYYNAAFNADKLCVNGKTVGISLHMTTDSPFGRGKRITERGVVQNDGSETALTIEDANDDVGYIYPDMDITVLYDDETDISVENGMFCSDVFKIKRRRITEEQKEIAERFYRIEKTVNDLDIDLSVTVYGNIDTDNIQAIEWTDDTVSRFSTALASYHIDQDTIRGTVTSVLGRVGEFRGVNSATSTKIAYSPILQTDGGPVLLPYGTVENYINSLIDNASGSEDWTSALLFLDSSGETVDGIEIKKLIADAEYTAERTSEIIDYTGKSGLYSLARRDAETTAKQCGRTLENFVKFCVWFFANRYTVDGNAMFIKGYEIYCELAAFDEDDQPIEGISRFSVLNSHNTKMEVYNWTDGFAEGVYRLVVAETDGGGKKFVIKKEAEDGSWKLLHDNIGYSYDVFKKQCLIGGVIMYFGEPAPETGSYIEMTVEKQEYVVGDDFNYQFVKIGNTQEERTNVIRCNYPCLLDVSYEPIIKLSP